VPQPTNEGGDAAIGERVGMSEAWLMVSLWAKPLYWRRASCSAPFFVWAEWATIHPVHEEKPSTRRLLDRRELSTSHPGAVSVSATS
jgi:hypothetical protein